MEENIELGFSMLLVGMTTVFIILFFVFAGGKILISFTNRFFPPETIVPSENENKKVAIITAAVEVATGGQGKIESIKKLN